MTTTVRYSNGSERTFKASSTAANEIDRHEGAVIITDGSDDVAEVNDPDADTDADVEAARVAAEEAAIAEAARVAREDAEAEAAKQAAAAAAAAAEQQAPAQVDPVTGLPIT